MPEDARRRPSRILVAVVVLAGLVGGLVAAGTAQRGWFVVGVVAVAGYLVAESVAVVSSSMRATGPQRRR